MKFDSILETVGNTPCVKINNIYVDLDLLYRVLNSNIGADSSITLTAYSFVRAVRIGGGLLIHVVHVVHVWASFV